MNHLTESELRSLLESLRGKVPASLSEEDQTYLKMYIPMQLGEESTKKMMELMGAIRDGKRNPLTDQERAALNEEHMAESLQNFLKQLSVADNEEFETVCDMCERIRASRS